RALQVERLHLPDRTVVEIDVDNRVVIRGTQTCHAVTQDEQLVDGLGIPRLEHVRQQPEAEMGHEPRTSGQQQGDRYETLVSAAHRNCRASLARGTRLFVLSDVQ